MYFYNSSHCSQPSLDCALAVRGIAPAAGGQLQLQLPDLRPGGGQSQETIRRGAGAEPGPAAVPRAQIIIVKQEILGFIDPQNYSFVLCNFVKCR